MTNKSLQQHINNDIDELNDSNVSGQRRRHLQQLQSLVSKLKKHLSLAYLLLTALI